jgi:hypothetical protein
MRIGSGLWLAAIFALGAGGCGGDVVEDPGSGGAGGSSTTGQGGGTGEGGGPFACADDAECGAGQWCVGGVCGPCDNSGTACDIVCPDGWSTYARNGCSPCECAPLNACAADADCAAGEKCYAGNFCWDWCPPGDPSCCFGNVCSQAGCSDPNPTGCHTTGCPEDQQCVSDPIECASSGCACDGQGWACTPDCNGGTCVIPL